MVYGAASQGNLDLAAFGSPSARGFRIDGAAESDGVGWPEAAGAGDVNGDARADLIIGAYRAANTSRPSSGSAYVVYGFGTASVSYPGPVSAVAGTAITALRPVVARTGTASFTVSPALPAGIVLDAATGVISGSAAQAASGAVTVTMSDLTGQASTSVQVTISAAPAATPAAAAPAASLPRLAAATRCKRRTCTTTGAAPRGATGVTQVAATATAATASVTHAATARTRRATGRCTLTTRGTGRKAVRTYRCTITLAKGRWTLTTTALKRSAPIARAVGAVTVR